MALERSSGSRILLRVFIILFAFALAPAALALPTFVQVNSATPSTPQSSVSVTYSSAQSQGNLNVIAIGLNDATSTITSVTDSRGNAYQIAVPMARGNGISQAIYYAKNIAAATAGQNSVTVQFNAQVPFVDIRILEYSGINQSTPFDVGHSASGTATTADSGSVITAEANELIFGAGMTLGHFNATGQGFSNRVITSDGDLAEDMIGTTAGSYHATAEVTRDWVMQVATFRSGDQSAPPPPPPTGGATITSLSGTFEQNNNLTIHGTAFGVKNPVAPIKWETFEDGQWDSDWTWEYGAQQWQNIHLINTANHGVSTTNAMMDIANFNSVFFSWVNGQPAYPTVYVNYWIKKNFTWSSNGDDAWGNVKYNRFVSGTGQVPNAYYGMCKWAGGLIRVVEFATAGAHYINWDLDTHFNNNVWHNSETLYHARDDITGYMKMRWDGSLVNDDEGLDFDASSLYGFIIGLGRVRDANLLPTDRYWLDDIYVDSTAARVMVGDNADFSSCHHVEIQIPHTTWNDNTIQFTANLGNFSQNEQLYLFVFNANDTPSQGFPIQRNGASVPIIDGVSGALAQGTNLTISGSNFGTKANPGPVKWKTFDDGSMTSGGWTTQWPHGVPQDGWSIEYGGHNATGFYGHRFYASEDDPLQFTMSGTTGTWFATFWLMMPPETTRGKFLRIWGGNTDGGNHNNFYLNAGCDNYYVRGGAEYATGPCYPNVDCTQDPNNSPSIPVNTWVRIDLLASELPSRVTVWMDGVQQWDQHGWLNHPFQADGHSFDVGAQVWAPYGPPDYRCSIQQTWVGGAFNFDDIYVDYTQARIEIGNASTWNGSTHREIQIPHTTWNDNTIKFTANLGTFGPDEQLYLFVIDANGSVSDGYPLPRGEQPPVIDSVSGTLAQGQNLTISGSGFGTKANPSPIKWKTFDDGNLTSGGWTTQWPHGVPQDGWTIESGGHNLTGFYGHRFYASEDDPLQYTMSGTTGTWFVSFWMFMPPETAKGKFFRIWGATNNIHFSSGCTYRNIIAGSEYANGPCTPPLCNWDPGQAEDIPDDRWVKVDILLRENPNDIHSWMDGVLQMEGTGWINEPFGGDGEPLDIGAQIFPINGPPDFRCTQHPTYAGSFNFDDIYVDYTQARIEIGNASTWNASTHREIQIPHTTWNDNTIKITANLGSFRPTDQLYLFVVDADGSVSQGYPLQQGSTTCGDADTNGNGTIEEPELRAYISGWFRGAHSLSNLIRAFGEWKSGC